MTSTTALAPAASSLPAQARIMRPIAKPADVIAAHKEAAEVIRDALEDGRDYGLIPGTGNRKVLLKPGAERLCVAFGLTPSYSVISEEIDHDRENHYIDKYKKPQTSFGLYRYVIKCQLLRDGVVVGEGIGSCSTMEQKYVSRPRDSDNTALKMAKKRAKVDAVLDTLSLSDRFTQDVGDDENDVDDDAVQTPPPAPPKPMTAAEYIAALEGEFSRVGLPSSAKAQRTAFIDAVIGAALTPKSPVRDWRAVLNALDNFDDGQTPTSDDVNAIKAKRLGMVAPQDDAKQPDTVDDVPFGDERDQPKK